MTLIGFESVWFECKLKVQQASVSNYCVHKMLAVLKIESDTQNLNGNIVVIC